MSTIITADVEPASAKEPSHDPRSRVVTSARARATCAHRTRARASAARSRRAGGTTRPIERRQFGALTACCDERSSPGCGVAGDLRPGLPFPLNQTGELRS